VDRIPLDSNLVLKLEWNSALSDPRMIDVLGVLMGINLQGFSREEGSDELPPGLSQTSPPTSPTPKSPAPATPKSPPPAPTPAPAPSAADVEMSSPEDEEEAKAKKEAEAEKKAGSDAYRQRDFDAAAKHYQKAWDVWPKDVTFLTNLGGGSLTRSSSSVLY
jgi:predicted lipid-binding transport protein (Tim44 family)